MELHSFIARKIVIKGLVQGIGYRPFVAETAEACGINGWVRNTAGIVTVLAEGTPQQMRRFLAALSQHCPPGARVDAMDVQKAAVCGIRGFAIEKSEADPGKREIPFIPPDLPTCPNCQRQLLAPSDRRYRYPFISCTACGPRYSILNRLPYDRDTITMSDFTMCEKCRREYRAKGDVRRHAQTIACHSCGPTLSYLALSQPGKKGGEALSAAMECIRNKGIVAVKDIGGFHLACSPYDADTVSSLRRIKGREKKPFAVMFSSVEDVRQFCEISEKEEEQLVSAPRPIVLLRRKKTESKNCKQEKEEWSRPRLADNVCADSPDIGAMLPSNPLQILLAAEFRALVMTSANRAGELMITDNGAMEEWMREAQASLKDSIPLGILAHDRRILTPLDDSVVRITGGFRQIFRRARGIVPEPVELLLAAGDDAVFAAGADLKSVFCYAKGKRAYLSQPFGDLAEEESLRAYEREQKRMRDLFGFSPQRIAADLHPAYHSAHMAVREWNLPVCGIQHHHAHAASVIAEHGLEGNVLCFAFDGTGYGTDQTVWGSECFLWDGNEMRRMAHLAPVTLVGGDESTRNTDSVLYGYLASFGADFESEMEEHWEKLTWLKREHALLVGAALKQNLNSVASSSMGRLFDAVSALLDICHYNGYEGEAPKELEYLAARTTEAYPMRIEPVQREEGWIGDTRRLFETLIAAVLSGRSREELARGFIHAVAGFVCDLSVMLEETAFAPHERKQIALSGGTFCNRILLEETARRLRERGFAVFVNEQVPCTDGGICLGQTYLAERLGR